MTLPAFVLRAAAALPAALALASCSFFNVPTEKFAPACPKTAILSDAADLNRFTRGGHDLTDMVIAGRITGLSGKCASDDPEHLRTTISVGMDLTRGPAAKGQAIDVQYFVAVADGEKILTKQDYILHVGFARNSDRVRLTGDEVELVLPVTKEKSGAAYSVLVGFQLTPDELAFNRARGVR
jgi:hypothetical protein